MADEVEITLASTTETQDELEHAVSADWRKPFDPEAAKAAREEQEKQEKAEADKAKKPSGSAPADLHGKEGENEDDEQLPRGVQKRIDKLTARSKTAESRNQELLARLEALEKKEKPAETAPPSKEDLEPAKKDFKDPDDWIKAHGRWAAREEAREGLKRSAAVEADQHTQETFDAHLGRVETFKEEHPDFDEKIDASKTQFSEAVAIAIVEADNGPAITYHLAEHPEELERISKLSRARQVMEIGKLSASLSPSESDEGSTTVETKHKTRTPAPITPINASKSATPITSLAELAEKDPDAYIRKRNEQEREARRNRR